MKTIRFIKSLSTALAATTFLTLSAFANTGQTYSAPDVSSSALLIGGAITAISFARRRFAK